jgi:mRNA interferase MazF
MPLYSRNDVVLVRYPFSDQSGAKVRPAVIVNAPHSSIDLIMVPLTSRIHFLLEGERVLSDWQSAGLNVTTAFKRGVYTAHASIVLKKIGTLAQADAIELDTSLRRWLHLS